MSMNYLYVSLLSKKLRGKSSKTLTNIFFIVNNILVHMNVDIKVPHTLQYVRSRRMIVARLRTLYRDVFQRSTPLSLEDRFKLVPETPNTHGSFRAEIILSISGMLYKQSRSQQPFFKRCGHHLVACYILRFLSAFKNFCYHLEQVQVSGNIAQLLCVCHAERGRRLGAQYLRSNTIFQSISS